MAEPTHAGDRAATMPRVLIVSEHASVKFGGEAILPWHYFRILRRRGVEAWLVVHERTRDELISLLPEEAGRIYFLPDSWINRTAYRLGKRLPGRMEYFTTGYLSRISTQLAAKAAARRMISEHQIDVIHQPIPVSPRETSLLYNLDVPVVIGPMNGNMTYPPAFARGKGEGMAAVSRRFSGLLHRIMPGKLRADALVVANERTRRGLPLGARGEIIELVENGVDLELWSPTVTAPRIDGPPRFIYLGRLVDWKWVDVLIDALATTSGTPAPHLEIVGDGPMRASLEEQARRLGVQDRVHFLGWLSQAECARRLQSADALLLSSVYECGGAVVLEAMASAIPVVATDWGGPSDYLDSSCGFLIAPASRPAMVAGFADAINRLAADPVLREQMGRAGRKRIEESFDWEAKVDEMLNIYRRVIERSRTGARPPVVASP